MDRAQNVYYTSNDGEVTCISLANGTLRWTSNFQHIAEVRTSSPALSNDDSIVYVGSSNALFALETTQGVLKFMVPTTGSVYGSPAVDPTTGNVYFNDDTHFWCVNGVTGAVVFSVEMVDSVTTTPTLLGSTAFMLSNASSSLSAISKVDGSLTWAAFVPPGQFSDITAWAGPAPNAPKGLILFAADNVLYAYNAADGGQLFTVTAGAVANAQYPSSSPAITSAGVIYWGAQSGQFYAIDSQGNKHWSVQTSGAITGKPVVGLGAIYFVTVAGDLYAVSVAGDQIWMYGTRLPTMASIALASGLLLVGSTSNAITAVGEYIPPLPSHKGTNNALPPGVAVVIAFAICIAVGVIVVYAYKRWGDILFLQRGESLPRSGAKKALLPSSASKWSNTTTSSAVVGPGVPTSKGSYSTF